MSTVSAIFLFCMVALVSCVLAISVALEAQLRHERYILSRMKITITKIDDAMKSDDRGRESY